ncbi:MAG: hypothetical protein ACRENN_10190 [Candidatus Eiseniibacteriota bacterium]
MSDKATMLREMDEALADLRAMFDRLTEEQTRRVWLDVSAVRDSLTHVRQHPVQNCDSHAARALQTTESTRIARTLWAPGSFWGLRYPIQRDGVRRARGAGHSTTILAWAFTIYMVQGYLLVPFDRFESANQEVCEVARAEAEKIGGTHDGWTLVVDERCKDSEKARGTEAKPH